METFFRIVLILLGLVAFISGLLNLKRKTWGTTGKTVAVTAIGAVMFFGGIGNLVKGEDTAAGQTEAPTEAKKEDAQKEKPKKKPTTLKEKVKAATLKTVKDEKRIKKIEINEQKDGKVLTLTLHGQDVFTKNMTRRSLLMDSAEILEEVFKVDGVSDVTIEWMLPGEDQYGNDTELRAMSLSLDKEVADKINWDNSGINERLPNLAYVYFIHPSLK